MSLDLVFWILMLITLVFGLWSYKPINNPKLSGSILLVFVLLAVLGWRVFGPAIK